MEDRSTRGLLATDHVILNHGQVTWTTPELAPPILTTTPHQREDVSALDRFNVHRCPTRRVFSGTGLEPVTKQATVRYLYHSATAATKHKPDGRGYELVSSVRSLVPQKFSVEEELMHVKHVEVKSPHVGVMWKFGREVISSGIASSLLNRGSKLRSRSSVVTVLT
ncbi:uncharacterized protein TNCV_2924331 [Trichonephila clavipes]|nr:uncharacterized protein TNCV_2924331 [Trichonephila clavipes]